MEEKKVIKPADSSEPEITGLVREVRAQLEKSYRQLEKNFQEVSQTVNSAESQGIGGEKELTTRLRALEAELAHLKSLASVGETVGMVIHALRNQLGGIIGFADLLERDLSADQRHKKYVQKINEGLQDLLKTVNNLLDYVRPDKLNLQEVKVSETLEKVLSLFEMELKHSQKQVKIQKDYLKSDLSARLDPEKFQHVVLNLLQNASQSLGESGNVTVVLDTVVANGVNGIRLRVRDNGSGIPAEVLKKVFTPFFTSKTGGTGLGLAAVKKIVEAHRGEVKIKSEVGKGTEVDVWIPRE
jgi:signal transduction histidine kinase